jgi:hypothetical protein
MHKSTQPFVPAIIIVKNNVECNTNHNGCFFKFGVEVSFVNALYRLRIRDQLFKSYAFTRVEWCDINRLSNAYFDAKFKKTPLYSYLGPCLSHMCIELILI